MPAANALTTPNTEITPDKTSGAERRVYPRLVFAPKDGVTAGLCFSTPDGAHFPIQARVMNLSRGGLGVGIPRERLVNLTLAEEDILVVTDLNFASRQVHVTIEVSAQIRWILDTPDSDVFFFGCAFIGPRDDLQHKLADFVAGNFPHLGLA